MAHRQLTLTPDERAAVGAAQAQSRAVRHWRRYQAVLLRADGVPVEVIARPLGCSDASVYTWTAAWRTQGVVGVAEGVHAGAALEAFLQEGDPQAHGYAATGWTVPLLRTEREQRGWSAAERTIRRTLHRLGWRWKRPNVCSAVRIRPMRRKKTIAEQAAATIAAGGEVWFGDEEERRRRCGSSRLCGRAAPAEASSG